MDLGGQNMTSSTEPEDTKRARTDAAKRITTTRADAAQQADAARQHDAEKRKEAAKRKDAAKRIFREVNTPYGVHPALIPGIGVDDTGRKFSTNWWVFVLTAAFAVGFVTWGLVDTVGMGTFARTALDGVSTGFGWLFSLLTIVVFFFMLIVSIGQRGRIVLGSDDEKPEFSTVSWVAMLFSAGMGIGLLFYGPYEPLVYFLDPPSGMNADPGTRDAMLAAMAQTMFHWGPLAWAYYALVGGAIAYVAYRRARSPLISSIFDPIFSQKTRGPIGAVIDIFAIIVTLFGTAVSLGIGALQIARGVEIVGGIGPVGNGLIIGIIAVLTCAFILSAVSGVKRGIRVLSNINMLMVAILAAFVFIVGPTLFLLNFIPSSGVAFFHDLATMLQRSPVDGPETAEFMKTWTTYYWAWWVSWTPFVGMFIAKISRGRTIRQFTFVVMVVPSIVCLIWFGIFGGTSMRMEEAGLNIAGAEDSQDILFSVLGNLPLPLVTSVVAMISVVIFFVTSADSASIVMGQMSQHGKPEPSKWVTITWGIALASIATTLLLAGGRDALTALQALVTVSALPFALVIIGIMIAWWRDLSTDPLVLRNRFAEVAIEQGIKRGIEEHGDDFVFEAHATAPDEGAGAWLDTENPELTEWYDDARTGQIEVILAQRDADEKAEQAALEAAETEAVAALEAAEPQLTEGAEPQSSSPADGEPRGA